MSKQSVITDSAIPIPEKKPPSPPLQHMADRLLPTAAPPMGDAEVASMLTWSVDQVCAWLASVGLDVFEKHFRQHEITGDILPLITLAELKDMNVELVGPRTQLLKKLGKLKRAYLNFQRNRPLW